MDDTHSSRTSDAAAATRKRRSSILKSQRPPRTPFSELEFNVATPTDTTKSRRVSFSRRTGVAEFITNEATTTWKNFYEEHNKSLESSGNESGANAPRPIGHLGKRMFDQQFQDVEAVDFVSTLGSHSRNINTSINNVNFTQQIASLECTGDDKLTAPQQNFDMSAFTDHQSKVFGDDLAMPLMGEMSGRIDVNFSAVQTIGEVKDDLDEIQNDLQRAQSNVVCPGPFAGRRSLSEYIEVDLNATHVTIKNNDDDMSITDTILSPKVQDVSKNHCSIQNDKKASFSKDWVTDKENIALNPYVTPKESTNFAVNDESDKILVFDGKRLTIQSDKEAEKILKGSTNDLQPVVHTQPKAQPRKTIVLNVNDDLPNFVEDPHMSTSNGILSSMSFKHSVMYDDDDLTNENKFLERQKSINGNDTGNISITQAVPTNIILSEPMHKEASDDADISVTKVLPSNIIVSEEASKPERRKTILFNNDTLGNISFTQAIPANIIYNEKSHVEDEKRKAIDFDNISNNISIPVKEVLPAEDDKINMVSSESDVGDVSMTRCLPTNIILPNEKRKMIVYEDEAGNISVTQTLPTNIFEAKKSDDSKKKPEDKINIKHSVMYNDDDDPNNENKFFNRQKSINGNDTGNISIIFDDSKPERRKTILYNNDTLGNISITQAIPANIIYYDKSNVEDDKIKTFVFDNTSNKDDKIDIISSESDVGDISMTRALPTNIILPNEKRKTIVYEDEAGNISVTQTLPTNIFGAKTSDDSYKIPQDKINIIVSDSNVGNISMATGPNVTLPNEKCKTIVFEEEAAISVSKNVTMNKFGAEKCEVVEKRKTILYESSAQDVSVTQAVLVNVLIVNNATENRKSVASNDEADSASNDKTKATSEEENIDSESGTVTDVQISEPTTDTSENITEKDSNYDVKSLPKVQTQPSDFESIPAEDNRITSSDNLIYIIRDTEDETQTEKTEDHKPNKSLTWKDDVPQAQHSPLSLEYKEEVDVEVTADLPKKLDALKSLVGEYSPGKNRKYEKIIFDVDGNETLDKSESDSFDISKAGKSFKNANDTDELLEMLSDLTDKRQSIVPEKPAEKKEVNEPRRLSVAPNRLSIVLSREDLLNNISMAQAALQRSIEMDESIDETTSDNTPIEELPTKKAVRVSNEVVKKLQFEEDESTSDASIKSEMKGTPLKKTAFGETSYMKESKAKVIPSYLKEVSDEIKALMSDLVKPNVDSVTFQMPPDRSLKRDPSTCSTQIQANLITSSQIDLETELTSGTDSEFDLEKGYMPSAFNMDNRSLSHRSFTKSSESEPQEISFRPKRVTQSPPSQDRVIVFDHYNPLNNVLLAPIDYSEVHRYNPHKSNETLCADNQSMNSGKEVDAEQCMNNRITQLIGNVTVAHSMQPSGDSVPDKSDAQSLLSNASKRTSIDESVSVRVCELKDTKVNTLIAMKGNKELLEASSSLTLVDDALAQNTFDVDLDMVTAQSSSTNNEQGNSPIKIIYHNDEKDAVFSENVDSDLTSTEELMKPTKGKKRIYSPTKKDKQKCCALSSLDITPKPISKMQKMSTSPKYESPEKLTAEKDDSVHAKSAMEVDECSDKTSPKDRKRSPRKFKSQKSKKPGTNVTVQQLLTKYDIHPDIDQDALNKQIIEALSRSESSTVPNTISQTDVQSLDIVSSFTSSKNQNEMRESCSETTTASKTLSSQSKMEWQPVGTETSSKIVPECESGVNVVAKIDMLPFMGSHECEWEASGIDTWAFRLLHARLRLSVRLAHRHDNATRTRVRADTPVLHVALDTVHQDKKNSVATLCVGFALEAMRYFVGRGWSVAGDVPALLTRCAGVARVALRWGRAMHEARLHLAYALSDDGLLALKVANIPLRSVWEVTMRLELVAEDAREVPWPRATALRVARVVSDVLVPDHEVARVLAHLPRDWGHAPRTIWKIFRYLKNKTRDDDLLGL